MRIVLTMTVLSCVMIAVAASLDIDVLTRWALAQQRAFQAEMAGAVHGLRRGDAGSWAVLLGAAGAYGFVHAVGPGHGKYLIGGVGLGSRVSAARLLGLALASSLAQAVVAIVLVYGGFLLLDISAGQATLLAENWLAPASYLAIALIGGILAWRGAKVLLRQQARHVHTHAGTCCGHAHGPSPEETARVGSLRDALVLIFSIAIRPCTGAIFLLVIARQMDIQAAGAAAVIVMGLGTALMTSVVAISSIAARGLAFASAEAAGAFATVVPVVQIIAGMSIIWISLVLLGAAMP